MLHIPTIASQFHELDQLEMRDNCFSVENRINLVQASQIPVKTIKFIASLKSPWNSQSWGYQVTTNQ